ncbi:MAG: PQQ-binding-like beta-propeller repeat protein, partial [Acidimicrobiales bacterium]
MRAAIDRARQGDMSPGGVVRRRGVAALAVLALALVLGGCARSVGSSRGGDARGVGGPRTGALSPVPPSQARSSSPGGDLTTYHYDNTRSGDGPARPSLAHIRRIWTDRRIDGAVYGEPLVLGHLAVVVTEDDYVYGIKASSGHVLWRASIGAPVQASSLRAAPGLGGCGNIFPLGITGTPVIDPSHDELFVAGEVQRRHRAGWQGIEHVMAAVSLSNGHVRWERRIDPPRAGGAYVVAALQQRTALSLVAGRVVAEFGGLFGDCGDYHGYVVSLAESGSGAQYTYRVPTAREGAIWDVSGAAAGSNGELFVATGNSSSTSRFDFANAVIGLTHTLSVKSFFAPKDWAALSAGDLDLGAGGPILLREPDLIFESGKVNEHSVNVGYLLDPGSLGGIGRPRYVARACPGDHNVVFRAFASARELHRGHRETFVYVPCAHGTAGLVVFGGSRPSFHRV